MEQHADRVASHGGASKARSAGPWQECPEVTRSDGTAVPHDVSVKVVLFGELKRLARMREVNLEVPTGSTIHTVARELGRICGPAFTARHLTSEGALQSHVAVFLNGVQLHSLGDAPARITDGQMELMLVPAYEGG